MELREFHNLARTGKVRVWRIGVDGDQVIIEHGEQGGKMRRVVDTAKPVNVGKANEKTGEQVALDTMLREILLKTRQGYVVAGVDMAAVEARRESGFDFDALPMSLRFYKPDNTPGSGMENLIKAGRAWFGRKRDGECFPIVRGESGQFRLYSRTMLVEHKDEPGILWDQRFPQIMAALEDTNIPPKTILLGEMVMDRDGVDDFTHVSRVMKSLKDRSLKVQSEEGWLSYYVWDIAFLDGQDLLATLPFMERYQILTELVRGSDHLLPLDVESSAYFDSLPVHFYEGLPTYDPTKSHIWNAACGHAHHKGWEGFVVVDPHGVYGDKGWNLRGKTDRPGRFCAKLKPSFEDDFVAMWDPEKGIGEYGTGKNQGLIGSVQLYQYNTAGILEEICQVGTGFTEQDLKELSDPSLYPLVFKVEYKERTYISDGEKTNALRHPSFIEVRKDKAPHECVNHRL